MTQWEYYAATWAQGVLGWKWLTDDIKKLSFYDALDGLGKNGWELVAAVPMLRDGETKEVEYLFKRPAN